MRILGIDTSTRFLCIGILDGNRLIADYNQDLDRRHSELLIPTVNKLLKRAKVSLNAIDGFACGIGPGSFTGLRIGLSAIKGFAFGLDKPVVGVPTLDIIAKNIKDDNGSICVVVDAKRDLIYNALYKIKNNRLKRESPYRLSSIEALLKYIKLRTIFVGDAVKLYKEIIKSKLKDKAYFSKQGLWYPKAANLLEIARDKFARNQIISRAKLLPLYLYPKECQIRRK